MKLTILGGTGRTGRHLITLALAAGHQVTALARNPGALPDDPHITAVEGSPLDPNAIAQVVAGADAVLSALGGVGQAHTTLYSESVRNILAADPARLIVVGAVPASPNDEKTIFERYLLHPLLHRFFGGDYDDIRRMEELLSDSPSAWTVLRPPRLTDGPATGRYRSGTGRLPRPGQISRTDLAAAMLEVIADPGTHHQFITVSY